MLPAIFLDSAKIKTLSEGWSEYLWAYFLWCLHCHLSPEALVSHFPLGLAALFYICAHLLPKTVKESRPVIRRRKHPGIFHFGMNLGLLHL